MWCTDIRDGNAVILCSRIPSAARSWIYQQLRSDLVAAMAIVQGRAVAAAAAVLAVGALFLLTFAAPGAAGRELQDAGEQKWEKNPPYHHMSPPPPPGDGHKWPPHHKPPPHHAPPPHGDHHNEPPHHGEGHGKKKPCPPPHYWSTNWHHSLSALASWEFVDRSLAIVVRLCDVLGFHFHFAAAEGTRVV